MKISDVMTRQVCSVGVHESLVEAARKMRWASLSALPVVDAGRLAGLITERDIVFRAVADGRVPQSVEIHEVMNRSTHSCTPDAYIADALLRMEELAVQHMPVVDPEGIVVGLVSYDDLTSLTDPDDEDPELVKFTPAYLRTRA